MENKDLIKSENYDLQIKSKKEEITNLIKDTVSQYYGLDLMQNTNESNKKKQEIAMFISKLITTKNKTGAPAILTSTIDSIRECALTFVNGDFDFFRNQAYLISYGDTLLFMVSKDGLVATAKGIVDGLELYSDIVYKNDVFEYEKIGGRTLVTKHEQKLANITGKIEDIECAYACAWINGEQKEAEIMTMQDIVSALLTAKKSLTEYHKNNPKIMLGKFPLRRLAKRIINQNIKDNSILNNIKLSEYETVEVEPIEENENQYIDVSFEDNKTDKSSNIENAKEEIKKTFNVPIQETFSNNTNSNEEKIGTIKEVYYSEWKNVIQNTGEWALTDRTDDEYKNGYNSTKKMAEIIKIK